MDFSTFDPQSNVGATIGSNVDMQTATLAFSNQMEQPEYAVDSQQDELFAINDQGISDLASFFARPVKISSLQWDVGSPLSININPWDLFFTNKRVGNRITNFMNMRCDLCVKFVINGNPFYYGRVLASYIPLSGEDFVSVTRAGNVDDLVGASMRPKVFLDPMTSQGGVIRIPYVWYKNNLNVVLNDMPQMGNLNLSSMQLLKHANGATEGITISTFAWAENVRLENPTSTNYAALVPQSGDEYGTGIISKPASAIAKMSGMLEKAPVIGKYARASSMLASGVGRIAHLFGFARPVSTEETRPYRPHYVGGMANADSVDQSTKLSLDTKQELSVDTRTFGLAGKDELDIKSIAQRETFLDKFTWRIADTAETFIWNCRVSPAMQRVSFPEIHFTALAHAALPFKYWRGTLRFRFQIVASNFHKGRLRFMYDPYSTSTGSEYNTSFVRIVDIAKERDFTMDIGWASDKVWLKNSSPLDYPDPFSATIPLTVDPDEHNGVLGVFVVNELTSPDSSVNNDIEINVYVSAGDDFEVMSPSTDIIGEFSIFEPQSNVDESNIVEEGLPLGGAEKSAINTLSTDKPINMVFGGESVRSFRSCIKRYAYHSSFPKRTAGADLVDIVWPNFPIYRGYDPNGIHLTSLAVPYTYSHQTLLNWLVPGYVCWRGGLRWKLIRTVTDTTNGQLLQVTRNATTEAYSYTENPLGDGSTSFSSRARALVSLLQKGWNGCTATCVSQQPVLEYDLPYYSFLRFSPGKRVDITQDSLFSHTHQIATILASNNSDEAFIHAYVAAGDDFTCGLYTGLPRMYFQTSGSGEPPSD